MNKVDWWTHIYFWFELEVDEYLESYEEADTPETRAAAEDVLSDLRALAFTGSDHEPNQP